MTVPAYTNEFGSFWKVDSTSFGYLEEKRSGPNGAPQYSQGSVNLTVAFASRMRKSSNSWVLVKGIPWRKASSYYRGAMVCRWSPGDYSYRSGTFYYKVTGFRHSMAGTGFGGFKPWSGILAKGDEIAYTDGQARARTECLLKLKERKANYGTFLAEAVRSADMVAMRLGTLADALLAVKHGRLGALKKFLGKRPSSKDLANGLLEWQYGWLPLCSDLYAIAQDLRGRLQPPLIMTAHRSVHEVVTDESDLYQAPVTWRNRSQVVNVTNKCQISARVSDSTVERATALGLTNPASLAWELVPYSFVVDWAVPVGNMLEALSASAGLTFVDGFESEIRDGTARGEASRSATDFSGSWPVAHCEAYHFCRRSLGNFPAVIPYGRSPFSSNHVLTATALLRQLFK